jgi:hypothetical protein
MLLGENINYVMEKTGTLLGSKKLGLEINTEKYKEVYVMKNLNVEATLPLKCC